MEETLFYIFQRLVDEVSLKHLRFLYGQIDLNNRLIGILGARGVGKTTLMLQYIKKNLLAENNSFYFSADHIYFNSNTIYSFVEDLFTNHGIVNFFIDEIHKYKNWNQELKNLYDGFPKIKIVFSGSSSLDIVKGSYDLSRRAIILHLPGLSFREYLNFSTNKSYETISFQDLVTNKITANNFINQIPKIKLHFKDYLRQGYYPFYFENALTYYERILRIIDKTIYEDIANFYNLKTENLQQFKKILNFLASIPPGTTNVHNISKNLSVDDKTITHYLSTMQETGLLNLVFPAENGNSLLRRPEKIFLNNTNLQYSLEGKIGSQVELGTIRELFFIQSVKNANQEIFHSKKGDFQINKFIFEIGGKNKTRKQIKQEKNAFLVKDDTLLLKMGEIPLVYFGFLY